MEDKKLKEKLKKIPDVDKNGDPIFKIADLGGKPKTDKDKKKDKKYQKRQSDFI